MDSQQELAKQIGLSIAKNRKKLGLSQAQLAELMGLSNDAISRMERGGIMLNVPRLLEFSKIFGCSIADLLGEHSQEIDEQAQYLSRILNQLDVVDRQKLLEFIEQLIIWKKA